MVFTLHGVSGLPVVIRVAMAFKYEAGVALLLRQEREEKTAVTLDPPWKPRSATWWRARCHTLLATVRYLIVPLKYSRSDRKHTHQQNRVNLEMMTGNAETGNDCF